MVLAGLFLILGVKEYLFRLYALLPAGLPAGRWRSHSSVWQAERGSRWVASSGVRVRLGAWA